MRGLGSKLLKGGSGGYIYIYKIGDKYRGQ